MRLVEPEPQAKMPGKSVEKTHRASGTAARWLWRGRGRLASGFATPPLGGDASQSSINARLCARFELTVFAGEATPRPGKAMTSKSSMGRGFKNLLHRQSTSFQTIDYATCYCRGYLVMRQLGQLEMRHSRLSTRWSTSTLGARMTTFSLVETMSVRSRDVLFDHHVAERIASPRSHSEDQ